ncbi:hypothetical protein RN001_014642 [Aquatica leii]|uniref:DDE Tnp4 domain-containing protein n=1 Tax=Aquatica leii TaxID=1421715 RepID=A0AAN7QBU4_9COLE|nr:hypothetical protein RN001_014642 [Aquatica leii]
MANYGEIAFLAAIEVLEEAEVQAEQPQRQFYHNRDAFAMSDIIFLKMFRFPKHVVEEIVDMVAPYVTDATRTSAISRYPLRPWLLTPLEHESLPESPEAAYNRHHKRTRCLIERCIGLLKMRFRCLLRHRVLHYAPDVASQIVNACVVLHNICIYHNVPDPEEEEGDDQIDFGYIVNTPHENEENNQARRINPHLVESRQLQRRIIRNHFVQL